MQYRKIINTDITVSEIGLGCWTLGGPNWEDGRPSGWQDVNEKEIIEAVNYAVDNGVNHFDNADVYGNGRAEILLAKSLGSRINDVVISSKVGYLKGDCYEHAYSPGNIRKQCELSLKNLNRDYIDIYYFHHGNFGSNDKYLDDACDIMNKLKDEGKIKTIGLSAYSVRDFVRLVPKIKPTVVQSWAHAMDYHFIAPRSPLMNLCEEYKMSFIAFSPLNQGILTGKYFNNKAPKFVDGDHRSASEKFTPQRIFDAERKLDIIRDKFGSTTEDLCSVALKFVLHHDNVVGVIPGFRNIEQVKINILADNKHLNGNDIAIIRKAFA